MRLRRVRNSPLRIREPVGVLEQHAIATTHEYRATEVTAHHFAVHELTGNPGSCIARVEQQPCGAESDDRREEDARMYPDPCHEPRTVIARAGRQTIQSMAPQRLRATVRRNSTSP